MNAMDSNQTTEYIKSLIEDNRLREAAGLLTQRIEQNGTDDEAYYLLGNVYRKQGNTRQAMYHYLCAAEINADSPAAEAYRVLLEIRNFINPDYNP